MSTAPLTPAAVVFAKDPQAVAAFYEALLQMTVTEREPGLVVLASAQFQLVVHGLPEAVAREITITVPPERRDEVPVKLCFPVDSLAIARARAPALGGALNPPEAEWSARGFKACDGHDPEGNVVQFRQAQDPGVPAA